MQEARRRKNNSAEAKDLLTDANSSSQHLAILHIAFMAVCAYVLVIVFGTTDLDLLIGKGIRLPIVDVTVPIVGFYAFVPYLVVLVHLNLLLQLQLLSRKLFAFDAAAPAKENMRGLRDRLHIFPYTYYLVGRPSPVVGVLVGVLVPITLVLLPLVSLFALQVEFLAYQNEAVTWGQRTAIWLDVALVTALWPIILHPRDDWRSYWRELIAVHVPSGRTWWAVACLFGLFMGLVFFLFSIMWLPAVVGLGLLVLAPLAATLLGKRPLLRWRIVSVAVIVVVALVVMLIGLWIDSRLFFLLGPVLLILAALWHPQSPRGSLALLFMIYVGPLVPLSLHVDGEKFEDFIVGIQGSRGDVLVQLQTMVLIDSLSKGALSFSASGVPHTAKKDQKDKFGELDETVGGKTATPDRDKRIAVSILERTWKRLEQGSSANENATLISTLFLSEIRRLDLTEQVLLAKPPKPETLALLRSEKWLEALDQTESVNLKGRSLRRAQLRGAFLTGGDLRETQLHGANLTNSQLQWVDLSWAQLQGADLSLAQMQGALLSHATLEGAVLERVQLAGSNLSFARMQLSNLRHAQLQGTDLSYAMLQRADLMDAQLQGARLYYANLRGAILGPVRQDLEGVTFNLAGKVVSGGWDARMEGADLRKAKVDDMNSFTKAKLVDLRGMSLEPMTEVDLRELELLEKENARNRRLSLREFLMSYPISASDNDGLTTKLDSCLATKSIPLDCKRRFDPDKTEQEEEFLGELHRYLAKLACKSPAIARGIIRQIPGIDDRDRTLSDDSIDLHLIGLSIRYSTRKGLQHQLKKHLDDAKCVGLHGLRNGEKDRLRMMP